MKPERIEEIYNEIGSYSIELHRDPASLGPAYLQDLISKTRGYINQVSLIIQEIHREKSSLETELDAFEAAFLMSSDSLLAEDHRVTRLPNIDDRRAMINMLLRDERSKILGLKNQVKSLGYIDKAVRHRHKELENTMSAIRMQKSLIESELRTGAFYGDESDASRKTSGWKSQSSVPKGYGFDLDEGTMSSLFDDTLLQTSAAAEPSAATSDESPTEPAPPPVDTKPQDVVIPIKQEPNSDSDTELNDLVAVEKFFEGDDYSDVFDNL